MVQLQGYPDYQRVNAQSGDIILLENISTGGSYQSPIQDAHGYGYLILSCNTIAGSAYFTQGIEWYGADSLSTQLSVFLWTPTPNGQQSIQIPVVSRYFRLTQTLISGPTTDNPLTAVFGCNVPANPSINSQPAAPFLRFQGSVAASSSVTVNAGTTIQGAASITMADNSNSQWELVVNYYDWPSASWQNLAVFFGSAFGQSMNGVIGLPPAPIRVMVDNTDSAAAHNLYMNISLL